MATVTVNTAFGVMESDFANVAFTTTYYLVKNKLVLMVNSTPTNVETELSNTISLANTIVIKKKLTLVVNPTQTYDTKSITSFNWG